MVQPCGEDGDRIAERIYVAKSAGSSSMGRLWKIWIDIVKERLKKRGLDDRQASRVVQDRSEWWGYLRGNAWGVAQGMNP